MKKIALAQMNVEYGNLQKNISAGDKLIQDAILQKCDLVILPELWSTGFDYHHFEEVIERNSMLLDHLQDISNQTGITICGSFIEKQGIRFFNSFNMIQPNLSKARYFKTHLFGLMHEDRYFYPGSESIPFHSPLGVAGLSICYDLRFSELFLNLRLQGVEVFLLTAHWPLARIHHWDVLLQARAIENQAYMIAVNSVGISGKDVYGGHSMIVAPDGEILLRAPNDEDGLYITEIDPDIVKIIREKFIMHR